MEVEVGLGISEAVEVGVAVGVVVAFMALVTTALTGLLDAGLARYPAAHSSPDEHIRSCHNRTGQGEQVT